MLDLDRDHLRPGRLVLVAALLLPSVARSQEVPRPLIAGPDPGTAFLFAAPTAAPLPEPDVSSLPVFPAQESSGWSRLAEVGPGKDALVTYRDGTLRGGVVQSVEGNELVMASGGEMVRIARTDIATVQIRRKKGTLAGGLIGFAVTGVGLTSIVCLTDDSDCDWRSWTFGIALLGIPGGLLGALIGSQTGGDIEIVP
jgi:hypothetical protein